MTSNSPIPLKRSPPLPRLRRGGGGLVVGGGVERAGAEGAEARVGGCEARLG